jgi:hypothetical protein
MAIFGRFPSWSDVYLGKNQLKLTVPAEGPVARLERLEGILSHYNREAAWSVD